MLNSKHKYNVQEFNCVSQAINVVGSADNYDGAPRSTRNGTALGRPTVVRISPAR